MKRKINNIALSGVFSAMIFAATFFIKIPVASGYVHLGDALIYISSVFLPVPWAVLSAVIGAGLADVLGGYVMYLPSTIIIKAVIAFIFSYAMKKQDKLLTSKTVLVCLVAGVITVGGYFAADMIISRAYAVADVWSNLLQSLLSAILFAVIAYKIKK